MPEYLHDANVKPEKLIIILLLAIFSFSAQAGLNDGLVAYYPFNGNANDASGNGNNGTINGTILTTNRFGTPNSAYYFPGNNDWISVPDAPSLDLTNGYTLSALDKFRGRWHRCSKNRR